MDGRMEGWRDGGMEGWTDEDGRVCAWMDLEMDLDLDLDLDLDRNRNRDRDLSPRRLASRMSRSLWAARWATSGTRSTSAGARAPPFLHSEKRGV